MLILLEDQQFLKMELPEYMDDQQSKNSPTEQHGQHHHHHHHHQHSEHSIIEGNSGDECSNSNRMDDEQTYKIIEEHESDMELIYQQHEDQQQGEPIEITSVNLVGNF